MQTSKPLACCCLVVWRSMSGTSPAGRMFEQKLNPISGTFEWVVVAVDDDDDDDHHQQPPLLATTSYLDMLNDSRRNTAYRRAIDNTLTGPCHVIDIGAGTGLLSMMAVRAMDSCKPTTCSNSEGKVTACESYLPMVKLMKRVLRLNGFERKVHVINKRSDELQVGVDITSRADVLVSEILDSELLGEGLIPTLQHAHDELLVENPQTVPYKATTYGQVVESEYLWGLQDLYGKEMEASDGIRVVPSEKEMTIGVKPQQFAMHCDAIRDEIKVLSEPFKIFEFDFWRRPESQGQTKLKIKATNAGTVHAVISWWVIQLDREGTIFYSTGPEWIANKENWCDHWKQCVYFIPGQGLSISKDEVFDLHAFHTETCIKYMVGNQANETYIKPNDAFKHELLYVSPERVAIYGDCHWRSLMLIAVKKALQGKVSPICVVADDSVFLTVAVSHLSPACHVISSFPGLREKGSKYLHAVAAANGYSGDRIKVLKKRSTCLTADDTNQKKVELVVGEPFYCGNDNMLPWQNLRFWKERTMLDAVLSSDAVIMPCKAILRVCAMSLPDLWRSRCCLSEIEGFDHSVVNSTLGACGDLPEPIESPCLPFFVWQCGENKGLSRVFTVMEFDFSKPMSHCSGKTQVEFTESGMCHGFVLWIDWAMDSDNSIVLAAGPDTRHWRYRKQGVKLLANPVSIEKPGLEMGNASAEIKASFNPLNGELDIKYALA